MRSCFDYFNTEAQISNTDPNNLSSQSNNSRNFPNDSMEIDHKEEDLLIQNHLKEIQLNEGSGVSLSIYLSLSASLSLSVYLSIYAILIYLS
jgi:hypothetical protein